ncbi:hypothetical protein BDD12DRAFT_814355 [Trichophaea hybrida]|nr:hypothetical protein BDD12DRAFT_814355 [Trichophaea hybrida]
MFHVRCKSRNLGSENILDQALNYITCLPSVSIVIYLGDIYCVCICRFEMGFEAGCVDVGLPC